MPIPNEYSEIMDMLHKATTEKKVHWRAGRLGISVLVSDTEYEIWAGTDENTDKPFVAFGLRDPKNPDLGLLDNWYVDAGDDDYEKLNGLYKNARRQALGIVERLESFKNLLRTSKTIGEKSQNKDDLLF